MSSKMYNHKFDNNCLVINYCNEWWGQGQIKTPEKVECLKEFKEKIQNEATEKQLNDDTFCKRWLIARQYNVPQAVEMFRKSMEFRRNIFIEEVLENYKTPEVIMKYMPGGNVGHDKEGSIVRIIPWGDLDMKGIMCSTKKFDLVKSKILEFENLLKDCQIMSHKLESEVVGQTIVFDMENVGTKHLWKPGFNLNLYLSHVLEDNYPEMMKRLFLINAPKLLPVLYKLAKPVISENMKRKITILGTDYKETLLKYIDSEELPAYLGGTKTDPDGNEFCKTLISYGGTVPKEYHLENTEEYETMDTVVVNSGDKFIHECVINVPNSRLTWEYKTEKHDIGFGVLKKDDDKWQEIVPVERTDCSLLIHDGVTLCTEPGIYALCFDNSFSIMTAKAVHYKWEIIEPSSL